MDKKDDIGVSTPDVSPSSARIAEVGDFARLDIGRKERCGMPEAVYGEGKTPDRLVAIARKLIDETGGVLITRIGEDIASRLISLFDGFYDADAAFYCKIPENPDRIPGRVALVSAGTCDLKILRQAQITLNYCGIDNEIVCDVGVACIERLLRQLPRLRSADVVLVFAGMEGALPGVIGGLIDKPVIAIPCSVGYGVSEGGFTALNAMLAGCAAGVTVVNIDNGFGAAAGAVRILRNKNAAVK